MSENSDPLDILWEQLLSREQILVNQAFSGLNRQEQEAVLSHLESMASEPGWHPEQRISAQYALNAIRANSAEFPE